MPVALPSDVSTGISADAPADALARRRHFPRGLIQPPGGFRFAADTLLLAAFAARGLGPAKSGKPLRGLDLGTGCGAASIALLLLRPGLSLTGMDNAPEMVRAAAENAGALGLAQQFQPLLADVRDFRQQGRQPGCDFVLANPPFRRPGTGRPCPDAAKDRARFEGPGGFNAFAVCAGRCLRRGGRLFLVHLAERLPEILRGLEDAGLAPRRILPLQGRADKAARLVLLSATRGGGQGLTLEPGLVLYGPAGALTPEALRFCPHLAANPRRNAGHRAAPLANAKEAG